MNVLGYLRPSGAVSRKNGLVASGQRVMSSINSYLELPPQSQTIASQPVPGLYHGHRRRIDLGMSSSSNEGDQPRAMSTDPLSAYGINIILQIGEINATARTSVEDQVEAPGQDSNPG